MHILVFRFITGGVHRPTHPAQEAWSFGEDTKGTQHQPQDPLSAQDPETSAEGHFGQKGFMVFTVTAHCFSSWVSSFCCFEQFCCSSFCFFVVVVFVLLSLFSQCIKLTIGTANVETPAETQSTTLLIFPGLDQIWLPKSLCNACCYWRPKSLCNACCHWLTRSLCNPCLQLPKSLQCMSPTSQTTVQGVSLTSQSTVQCMLSSTDIVLLFSFDPVCGVQVTCQDQPTLHCC